MVLARIQLTAECIALLALASTGHAAGGVTGADILRSRLGARPMGMGEAYVALGDDLASTLYNPAGLTALRGPSLGFTHVNSIAGIAYEDFTYGHPLFFGTLATDLVLRSIPDINNKLATDTPVGAYDLVWDFSYAFKPAFYFADLPERLRNSSFGISVKWVRSHLGRFDADSVAFDLGGRLDLGDDITLGVSSLNLGPPIRFIATADPLPAALNIGLSKRLQLFESNTLNAAVDLEYPLIGDTRLHFGLEDWLGKGLGLRVGYIMAGLNDTGGLSAGFTLRLDQETLLFSLDYAFHPVYYDGFNSFESQHLFAMNLGF